MKSNRKQPRGTVLLVAMVAIIVALSVALSMLQTTVSNSKGQDQYTVDNTAAVTTHAATEFVMSALWGGFNSQTSTTPVTNFVTYLGNNVTFSTVGYGSADKIAEDFRLGPNSYAGSVGGAAPVQDNPTKVYRGALTTYNDMRLGDRIITGVRIYKKERPVSGQFIADILVVAETQKYTGATAAVQATLASNMTTTEISNQFAPNWEAQLFKISSPPDFNGFDYALLTKNLTCTCCHFRARNRTLVDNLNQYNYWTAQGASAAKTANLAALTGQWNNIPRVKVGITEYLGVRAGGEYTQIDGTLYQRGLLQYEGDHSNMTASNFMSEQIDATTFSSNTSTGVSVAQNTTTGATTPCPFVNQTTDSSGATIATPAPNGNLYLDYSSTNNGQTDGQLPASNFPAAFPEIPAPVTLSQTVGGVTTSQTITGPNNKVDSNEVDAAKTNLNSAIDPTQPSTLKGGSSVFLAAGTAYSNTTLPAGTGSVSTSGGNVAAAQANISKTPTTAGNLIITGTVANPIKIDGKVLIDGDVIIRGYVQGTGQLYATGNIYVPGDIIYNNDNVGTVNETFGTKTNTDGSKTTNLFAMVAGKNIVVGDYLSQVTHWASGYSDFYTNYTVTSTGSNGANGFNYTMTANQGTPDPGQKVSFTPETYSYQTVNGTKYPVKALTPASGIVNPHQMDIAPTTPITQNNKAGTAISTVNVSNVITSGASGSNSASDGSVWGGTNFANFTVEQMAYFNRNELMKSMPKLPTQDPTVASSYTGSSAATNPNYDPNYIPKYYTMYAAGTNQAATPPLAFLYNGSTYDSTNQHWNGTDDPHVYDYFTNVDTIGSLGGLDLAANKGRNIINIHPTWIDPNVMMKIISAEQDGHVPVVVDPQYGTAPNYTVPDRRLDGVLYTNNAIFCIERMQSNYYNPATGKWSKVAAKSSGYMQVNGALIAPDTGILVTGNSANNFKNDSGNRQAFLINYDARVKNFMAMTNQDFSNQKLWGLKRRGVVQTRSTMPPGP